MGCLERASFTANTIISIGIKSYEILSCFKRDKKKKTECLSEKSRHTFPLANLHSSTRILQDKMGHLEYGSQLFFFPW